MKPESNSILNMATPAYIDTYIKEYADCLYSVERGLKSEVVFSGSDRYVENFAGSNSFPCRCKSNGFAA